MTMRHAAGGAGSIEEPDKTLDEPVGTEERTDRTHDGPEGGAPAAITGTSLAGPTGGTVGAMADGSLTPVDGDSDHPTDERS